MNHSRPLVRSPAVWWLAAACLIVSPAVGQEAPPDPDDSTYGDDYAAGTYGRIRYEENGVTIVRAETERTRDAGLLASVNTGVFPGDAVSTDPTQRVEVQLAQGSLVRIDRATELTFLALPDPYSEFPDHTVLQVRQGAIRISAILTGAEEFRVDTPAGTVYVLGDADLRIEVFTGGTTRITSRRGVAEVVGNGGSVLVRGGMQAEVHPGSTPNAPVAFNTLSADDFDRWVDMREADYREALAYAGERAAYEDLPTEVQPYYDELSANGQWRNTAEYGWIWSPNGVGSDWQPYEVGYWDYGPGGYFWVSNEPWGWAPYHYGRWAWAGGAWGWVPGRVFAGAWVSWSWGSAYVGWGPLNCWGSPYPYYGSRAWVFAGYNYFYYGHHGFGHHHRHHRYYDHGHHYHDHYRKAHHVRDDIGGNAIVTRPPRTSPRELVDSADSRSRAAREVQADRANRIDRATSPRASRERFDSVERDLVNRGQRSGTAAADRGGRPRRTGSTPAARAGNATPSRTLTSVGSGSRGTTSTRGGTTGMRTYPRVISGSQRDRSIRNVGTSTRRTPLGSVQQPGSSAGRGRPPSTSSRPSTRSTVPRVETRQSGSRSRLQDLYRRVTSPSDSRAPAASSSGSRSSGSVRSPRSSPPPKSGGTTARPSRSTQPRSSPSARPSSGSSQRRSPSARSSSGSSQRRSPSARSSSGSSQRRSPSARSSSGSRSRSSGSASRGSSGSSRSGGSSRSSGRGRGGKR